ncbi:hypothetical protein GW17_00017331 [Ensete ventricosum]|nr:hypothetical protein GW17_00017331 [Ensete ventricosum]
MSCRKCCLLAQTRRCFLFSSSLLNCNNLVCRADIIRDYKTGDSLCYAFIALAPQGRLFSPRGERDRGNSLRQKRHAKEHISRYAFVAFNLKQLFPCGTYACPSAKVNLSRDLLRSFRFTKEKTGQKKQFHRDPQATAQANTL